MAEQGDGEMSATEAEEIGEQALEFIEGFARRLGQSILDAESPEAAASAIGHSFMTDAGALSLLESAYEEGRESAMLDAARFASTDATKVGPAYEGARSHGERAAIRRDAHLCGRCASAPICRVAAAIPEPVLVTVSRCLAYAPAKR